MIRAIGDFSDEFGRMRNKTRRLNFCKTMWVSVQRHLGAQIKVIAPRVSQEMAGGLVESCEQFGNEVGSQVSSLKDVQGGIISGVQNMAQVAESNLTANEESGSKQEQVPTAMFTELTKNNARINAKPRSSTQRPSSNRPKIE